MLVKTASGKKTFVFSPFCPQKNAILGIFDCYFRVSDARKSDLDARKPAP